MKAKTKRDEATIGKIQRDIREEDRRLAATMNKMKSAIEQVNEAAEEFVAQGYSPTIGRSPDRSMLRGFCIGIRGLGTGKSFTPSVD